MASKDQPPGPSLRDLPSLIGDMMTDEIVAFEDLIREHGELVKFPFKPGVDAYLLCRPEWVQHVLQDNHRNYRKAKSYEVLRPLLGNGLLLSEGDYWLRQRRLVAPMFHRKRVAQFVETMGEMTGAMLDAWEEPAENGETIDVASEMARLTLGIAGKVLFNRDISGEASSIGPAMMTVFHDATQRVINPFHIPLAVPTPKNLGVKRAIEALEEVVFDLIEERRGREEEFDDLLSMLMLAEDEESGERMTDRELRDEVMTFILAGHETTSNALAWALYLLSQHPSCRRRLEAEVDELDGAPAAEDLRNLEYTSMVFDETTRLYPPAWTIERTPKEDDEIDGYTIPAGCVVMTSPYFVHRNPAVWDNPTGFDPERFSPERRDDHHRYAHFPFGGGPRLCVGADLALAEFEIVLSMIVQRYRLDLEAWRRVVPEGTVTLRPTLAPDREPGLPMVVSHRQ